MKFQNNWRQKSLGNLEPKYRSEFKQEESSITKRFNKLIELPLEDYTIDDVRFMIIQETGLPYLITLAIEVLQNNLFAEGNYYEGDLLSSVLKIKPENWNQNKDHWLEIEKLIQPRIEQLREFRPRLDIDNFLAATLK